MPNPVTTPNMSLIEPGVGTTVSPTWAKDLNADLSILDSHNHSPGSGIQINPNGININSDLSFNTQNAINILSTRFIPQTNPLSGGSDIGCVYVSGVDLYYNDANGNQIQITASGAVAGTPGSIANLTSPASATWVSADATFVWAASSGVGAFMDSGSLVLRNPGSSPATPSGHALIIQPDAATVPYTLTLPAAVPSAITMMQMGTSGDILLTNNITGDVSISGSLTVHNALFLDDGAVSELDSTSFGLECNISNGIMYPKTHTSAGIRSNNVSGRLDITSTGSSNPLPIVVSSGNPSTGLRIIRGVVSSSGSILSGEGFSVAHSATGRYTVTFTSTFSDIPACVVTPNVIIVAVFAKANGLSATSVEVDIFNDAGGATDSGFSIIAIGLR